MEFLDEAFVLQLREAGGLDDPVYEEPVGLIGWNPPGGARVPPSSSLRRILYSEIAASLSIPTSDCTDFTRAWSGPFLMIFTNSGTSFLDPI